MKSIVIFEEEKFNDQTFSKFKSIKMSVIERWPISNKRSKDYVR